MMEEEDEFSLKYTVFGGPVLLKEWIYNHKGGICAGGRIWASCGKSGI